MDIGSSPTGDIGVAAGGVTQLSIAESVAQRIDHVLRSKPGDWAREPDMGAYLAQYVGYPNVPATKVLIEDELTEEFNRDRILGAFPSIIEYTPTSLNTGIVEITVKMPDGSDVSIHREINPAYGINPSESLPYTPPQYDAESEITRTELVTLSEEDNTFELSYLPISNNVFIEEYNSDLILDENGQIDPILSGITQTFDSAGAADIVFASGQAVSGELPSGVISLRDYGLDHAIQDAIENKMVDSVVVVVDGTTLDVEDYRLSTEKVRILESYSEYIDGELIRHGVEETPSGEVSITIDFYDSPPIVAVDSFEQDSAPNNVFPRHRLAEKNFVTTKQLFEPGTYFIQYLSYELEV